MKTYRYNPTSKPKTDGPTVLVRTFAGAVGGDDVYQALALRTDNGVFQMTGYAKN